MGKIAVSVPSMIQGISQQPPSLRFASQAQTQENAYPSIVNGLQKRHPFELGGRAVVGGAGEPLVHFINRDENERYMVLVGHNKIRAYELGGVEIPVKGPGPGYVPDFSLLDLTKPSNIANSQDYDNGVNWTYSAGAMVAVDGAIVGPLGEGVDRIIGTMAGSGAGAHYTHTPGAFGALPVTISVYIHQDSTAPTFYLDQFDTTNTIHHRSNFTWSGNTLTAGTNTNGARGSVTKAPGGWWRAIITFQPGSSAGGLTGPTDALSFRIGTDNFDAGVDQTLLVWGLRMDQATVPSDNYYRGNSRFRALSVADYTFILNTDKVTAMAGTTSPTDPSLRTAFLFVNQGNYSTDYAVKFERTGVGSPSNVQITTWDGTGASVQNVWNLTISTPGTVGTSWSVTILGQTATKLVAGGDTNITVRNALITSINALPNVSAVGVSTATIQITGDFAGQSISPAVTPATAGTFTLTETVPVSGPGLNSIQTDDIAIALATKISAISGWTATANGSVVKVVSTTDILMFESTDSVGDSTLTAMWKTVRSVQDLPLLCLDGFVLKVVGETSDTADDYYVKFIADVTTAFGRGHWEETLGYGLLTTIDAATMPWTLTRRQDDVSGTITGIPNGKYFEWSKAVWATRLVGDNTSAPIPSFIGQKIAEVFFHRNRLGFLAGQNVILSEAAVYFNFFRSTVLQLVDSDLIDISAQHTSVVNLRNCVPANETLYVFSSGNTEFRMDGEPILTPKTVAMKPILAYEHLLSCRPISSGGGVFFAFKRGAYTGIREILPSNTVQDAFVAEDVSSSVPAYVQGNAIALAFSSLEGLLVILSDADRNSLYIYKTFFEGDQKLQSAWSKYTFGPRAHVMGHAWMDSDLYVAVQHDDGVWIEHSRISDGFVDDGSEFTTYLDRRYTAGSETALPGTYDVIDDTTTFTLAFTPDEGDEIQVVTRGETPGVVLEGTVNGAEVSVPGDYSGEPVWIGKKYTMLYEFSKPNLKQPAGQQGKVAQAEGVFNLLWGRLIYSKSAYFRIQVNLLGRDPFETEFTGSRLGTPEDLVGGANLDSGVFEFGVFSPPNEASVVVLNDSPLPSNLESLDWEATYTTKNSRFPA